MKFYITRVRVPVAAMKKDITTGAGGAGVSVEQWATASANSRQRK